GGGIAHALVPALGGGAGSARRAAALAGGGRSRGGAPGCASRRPAARAGGDAGGGGPAHRPAASGRRARRGEGTAGRGAAGLRDASRDYVRAQLRGGPAPGAVTAALDEMLAAARFNPNITADAARSLSHARMTAINHPVVSATGH